MQASAQKIWGTVQQSLQSMVSAELYRLWFSSIRPKSVDRDCLTLEVENDFCEVWLEKNYLDLIREKAMLATGRASLFRESDRDNFFPTTLRRNHFRLRA